MASDLVERLRAANKAQLVLWPDALIEEAADRIEALEAALLEVSKLAAEYPTYPLAHTLRKLTGGDR
jgi:hypothetical protein